MLGRRDGQKDAEKEGWRVGDRWRQGRGEEALIGRAKRVTP